MLIQRDIVRKMFSAYLGNIHICLDFFVREPRNLLVRRNQTPVYEPHFSKNAI